VSTGATTEAWDALARAAAGRHAMDESRLLRELLCFTVDGEPYAVPVERVREIVRLRLITEVPRVPDQILGVITLRGEVVQVLDLRLRLGVPAPEPSRTHRIVVLHGDEGEVTGLLVDTVSEVLRVEESEIQPPATGDSDFITGLCTRDDQFVGLLNLERVLDVVGN
jgi:purine-binding chemotaxis protein CheW